MLTWVEINLIGKIDRRRYEEEWHYRKVYEKNLLTIDKLYDYFLLWCLGHNYNDIANHNANKAWQQFRIEEKAGNCSIIKDWIDTIENSMCAKELQQYFNSKVKNTPIYVYKGE